MKETYKFDRLLPEDARPSHVLQKTTVPTVCHDKVGFPHLLQRPGTCSMTFLLFDISCLLLVRIFNLAS